jgi:hypothetical protein
MRIIMAETMTRSDSSMSSLLRGLTFISTIRMSHSRGSIAATVMSPNGGMNPFFLINGRAYLKLQ